MPPCKSVLLNKIKRTNFLANMVKSSSKTTMDLNALECGWIMNADNELEIEYFNGNPYPETITDMASGDVSDNEEEEEAETYLSSDDDVDEGNNYDDDDDDWRQ